MRPARLLTALLVLTAPLTARLAHAQGAPAAAQVSPGVDEVSLKNGGLLRGTVLSIEPNKQVVILVGSESRTVPWAEVANVERGKYAAPPAAPPSMGLPAPSPLSPAGSAATMGLGMPRVHIASDNPNVTLNRVNFTIGVISAGGAATGVATQVVCRAPCDKVIEGNEGQDFFFAGDGITPSRRFALSDKGGDLVANVEAGSLGRRIAGVYLTLPGGGVTLSGALILGLSAALNSSLESEGSSRPVSSLPTVGVTMLGVGAAMLVTGIVLWSTSGTSVTFASSGAPAPVGKVRFERGALVF